jgi:hypothetical protein
MRIAGPNLATFRIAAAALAALLLTSACTTEPSAPAGPKPVSFEAQAPLRLDIASISVESRYQAPGRAPNVEHLYSVTPVSTARAWAASRIVGVGPRGTAVLTVLEGSVISEDLPKKGGLTAVFGDQRDVQLTARLKARLDVNRPGERPGELAQWSVNVEASANRTVLESASLNERDAAYGLLMQQLAREFDAALTAEIRRSMSAALR